MEINRLLHDMATCEQTKGLSILDHGVKVREKYLDILDYIFHGRELHGFKLPSWIDDDILKDTALLDPRLSMYHIFHDCGKPYCIVIDPDGKRHFPNHVKISADIWYSITNDEFISNLILHDMDIHLIKNININSFCDMNYCLILLITGLAEIHANSDMFGGIESTSFKIKFKHINKNGKRIIDCLKNKNASALVESS